MDVQTSPEKSDIKIVSPSKLLAKVSSTSIMPDQDLANNNSKSKKPRVSSSRQDPKLKRQETSRCCSTCKKNFVASKFDAHLILKHLHQVASVELRSKQAAVSCEPLQC